MIKGDGRLILKMVSKSIILFIIIVLILFMGSYLLFGRVDDLGCTKQFKFDPGVDNRNFFMGFSTFPSDYSKEGLDASHKFIRDHGDIVLYHFDHGPPWLEALNDEPFPDNVMDEWNENFERKPEGHKLYVSITMTDTDRVKLADTFGRPFSSEEKEEWMNYQFNHENVKKAYLNYARRVVEFFDPDYLAIAIEINGMLNVDDEAWEEYKDLHKYIYTELKKEYPDLKIFATFMLAQILGYDGADAEKHEREIIELMNYSDLIGLSAYPHGWPYPNARLDPVPERFFDEALKFGKPIAITETGAPTENFESYGFKYRFRENYQKDFIESLLRNARENNYEFVILWTGIDFDKLFSKWPTSVKDLVKIWAYTGLQDSRGCKKEAFYVWDAWKSLKKV